MLTSPILKIALLYLALLTLNACNGSSPNVKNMSTTSDKCPEKPDSTNIILKNISLDAHIVKASGRLASGKPLAYVFEGKAGQKLNYQTKEDICMWVYTPDTQLLSSNVLPVTGKYSIQLASRQGTKTFELEMGLDIPQQASSPSPTSTPVTRISQLQPVEKPVSEPIQNRPAADEFVKDYYLSLKNRNYQDTWNKLSPEFQRASSTGYSDYLQWWSSVNDIKIGEINLIKQSGDVAVVNAELYYVLKNGKFFEDTKKHVYLVWNDEKNSWLFQYKSEN